MLGAGSYRTPCFAGDLNDHLVVHSHMNDGGHLELHVAQHDASDNGKKLAVAYMRALLACNLAALERARVAGDTGDVPLLWIFAGDHAAHFFVPALLLRAVGGLWMSCHRRGCCVRLASIHGWQVK
jgi:hypothetical protein